MFKSQHVEEINVMTEHLQLNGQHSPWSPANTLFLLLEIRKSEKYTAIQMNIDLCLSEEGNNVVFYFQAAHLYLEQTSNKSVLSYRFQIIGAVRKTPVSLVSVEHRHGGSLYSERRLRIKWAF